MTEESFEMPDLGDLASQMEEAMAEAQKAMEDLPGQMEGLQDVMGSLSALMGGMPEQMQELSTAMAGFGEAHEANVAAMAGDPDWSIEASIRVGTVLHVVVHAALDLEQVRQAWNSTQSGGFESLIAGVAAQAGETDPGVLGQITEQLSKGRSIARVEEIEVLACRMQGAPADAAQDLQLSPEGNIPLVLDSGGLGFEFAPLLTIRNRWERANIPTFVPMGNEVVVPLDRFEPGEAFSLEFQPAGQEEDVRIALRLQPR